MGRTSTCKKNDEWRECWRCGEYKIWDMFYKNKCKELWYSSTCIRCCSEIKSKWTFERQSVENRIEWQRHSSKKYERVVEKETRLWSEVYPPAPKQIWEWEIIEIWTNPHPFIFTKIK